MRSLIKGIFIILVLGLTSAFAQAESEPPTLDPDFSRSTFGTADNGGQPAGIAQSEDGSIYIASHKALTKLNAAGHKIWSKWENRWFHSCNGIGIDNEGNVYVAVSVYWTWDALVLKYNPQGQVIQTRILAYGFDGPPLGIVFDRKYDRLYVSSYDEIHCFDKNLGFIKKQITRNLFPHYIFYEAGLDVDKNGNVYVGGYQHWCQERKYAGLKYAPELSSLLWKSISPLSPTLDYLLDMAARPDGGMYIVGLERNDQGDYEISVNYFTSEGVIEWRTNFLGAVDLTTLGVDKAGNVYVGASSHDWSIAQLVKLDEATGEVVWSVTDPYGLAFTQALADEQNRIYAVGWPMDGAQGKDTYISRYLQGGQEDTTAPAAVADLRAINVSTDTITLEWTAPGDDENEGTAKSYDLRYTTVGAIISNMDFSSATQVSGVPVPQIAGSTETFTVAGLNMGTTYYFALKTEDEAENISELSNSLSAKTLDLYTIRAFSPIETQLVTVGSTTAPMKSLVNIFNTTNPASGIRVDFSISTFPAGAEGQKLTVLSTNTNSNGFAETQLKLGDIPAEYGVMATCKSCIPEQSTVTFNCCGKLPNDHFSQKGVTAWSFDCYARHDCSIEPKTTIGYLGCGSTSLGTLINYYSDNVHTTIPRTNPGQLNTYLRELPNYQGYNVDNDVDFNAIESYSNGLAFYIGRYDVGKYHSEETLLTMANDMILMGEPIMLRIGGHFVLAIGKCGDSYIVADPIGGVERLYNPDDLNDREFSGIRLFYHY